MSSSSGREASFESVFTFPSGVSYNIRLDAASVAPTSCTITLQSMDGSHESWSASFTAEEIEQMSQKTGVFQSLNDIIKMLVTLIRQRQQNPANTSMTIPYPQSNNHFNTLMLDVLTYEDLELLKQKRRGEPYTAPTAATPRSLNRRKLNKRYMILTIGSNRNEDEKIHYPLPLPFIPPSASDITAPGVAKMQAHLDTDVNALKAEISRLTASVTSKPPSGARPSSAKQSKSLYHSASEMDVRAYQSSQKDHPLRSSQARSRSRSHSRSRSRSRSNSPRHSSNSHRDRDRDQRSTDTHDSRSSRHSSSRKHRSHHRIDEDESPSGESLTKSNNDTDSAKQIQLLETQLRAAQEALQFEKQVSTARIKQLEQDNRHLRRKEKTLLVQLSDSQKALAQITLESDRLKAKVEEFMLTTRATTAGRARSRHASPVVSHSSTSATLPHIQRPPHPASQSPSQQRIAAAHRARSSSAGASRSGSTSQHERRDSRGGSRGGSPNHSGRNSPSLGHSRSGSPSQNGYARSPSNQRPRSASPSTSSHYPPVSPSSNSRAPRVPIDLDYRHWPLERSHSPSSPLRRFNPSQYVAMKQQQLAAKAAEMAQRHAREIARVTKPASHLVTGIVPPNSKRRNSAGRNRSPSPSASMDSLSHTQISPTSKKANGEFSNAYRGRREPPPTFEYLDSPGRSGKSLTHPSVYVSTSNDRARSLRFPLDNTNQPLTHKSLNLSRSSSNSSVNGVRRSESMDEPDYASSDFHSSSSKSFKSRHHHQDVPTLPTHQIEASDYAILQDIARSARSLGNYPVDELIDEDAQSTVSTSSAPQHVHHQSSSPPTSPPPTHLPLISAETVRELTHSSSDDHSHDLEAKIPQLTASDLESEDASARQIESGPTNENVDNVQALTDRLAKLQEYLAAEKAKT